MPEHLHHGPSVRPVPFTEERIERLPYRLDGESWTSVLDRLEHAGWETCVAGPAGSGKSTFLDSLRRALEDEGFLTWRVRLDPDRRRSSGRVLPGIRRGLEPDVVLLVDGADGLGAIGRFRLRRLARKTAGLVVAARLPVPGLPVLHETRTSVRLLEDLVLDLAPWGPRPSRSQLRRLYLRHGGDVGAALRALAAGWPD